MCLHVRTCMHMHFVNCARVCICMCIFLCVISSSTWQVSTISATVYYPIVTDGWKQKCHIFLSLPITSPSSTASHSHHQSLGHLLYLITTNNLTESKTAGPSCQDGPGVWNKTTLKAMHACHGQCPVTLNWLHHTIIHICKIWPHHIINTWVDYGFS